MTDSYSAPEHPLTVNSLVEQARENEHKWQRIHNAELKLMSANSLQECLGVLLSYLPRRQGWDRTCLTLVDDDYSLRRMLSGRDGDTPMDPALRFVDSPNSLDSAFEVGRRPIMERYRERRHARLFGAARLESVCILPLVRGTRLVGSLALGSRDPERFTRTMAAEFLQHLAAVAAVSIEAVSARDRLRMVSLTDPLTGVTNRRFFDRRLQDEMLRARREGVPLSLLFIDVDHFKTANDVGGHAFGDRALREIATTINTQIRSTDVLCRYGGDEFACLLINTQIVGANEIALRICTAVRDAGQSLALEGVPDLTVSIGVSVASQAVDTAEALLQRADDGVYAAKANGRNGVVSIDEAGGMFDSTEPVQLKLA